MSEGGARPWRQPAAGASVTVRVPASSANLGPGFDSVGMALGIWDEVSVSVVEEPGVVVEVSGEGAGAVPLDERYLVVRSLAATMAHLGLATPAGLRLRCVNAVPHSRGLGSSATAIVTGALAGAALAHPGLTAWSAEERPGPEGERVLDVANQVSSALEGHPDNASASVYGGATISVMSPGPPPVTSTTRVRLHDAIDVVALVPATRLSTAHARSVLPIAVPLATAVASTARGALLAHALTADPGGLLAGTADVLHQEQRRQSYPGSMALVDALRARGHAAVVSGAGPAVLVVTTHDRLDDVRAAALADTPADVPGGGRPGPGGSAGWQILTPGVPGAGATVTAVVH